MAYRVAAVDVHKKMLAVGETNPAALAALADCRLRATPAELRDALGACTELHEVIGGC